MCTFKSKFTDLAFRKVSPCEMDSLKFNYFPFQQLDEDLFSIFTDVLN